MSSAMILVLGGWSNYSYSVIPDFAPMIQILIKALLNARFFKQYFLLLCIHQMASGLFRFIGAVGRNVIVANTFGSFGLLAVMVLGGFIISRGQLDN